MPEKDLPQTQPSPEEQKAEDLKRAKNHLAVIFENNLAKDRVPEILKLMHLYLKSGLVDEGKIISDLLICEEIKDQDEFVRQAVKAIMPILDLKYSKPEKYNEIQRLSFHNSGKEKFITMDKETDPYQIYSYGIGKNEIHLHHAPATDIPKAERMPIFIKFMQKLAQEIKNINLQREKDQKEKLEKIVGSSWMLETKTYQTAMQLAGFEYKGLLPEKERLKYFPNEDRPVGLMEMDLATLNELYDNDLSIDEMVKILYKRAKDQGLDLSSLYKIFE